MSEEFKINKELSQTLKTLHKAYGSDSIAILTDGPDIDVEWYPTGSMKLDNALGGGFPKGRIIEMYGPESGGKTTLALTAIAETQKRHGICAFLDVEHALDPIYAGKLGVQLNQLLLSQPGNAEQALEIAEALVRSGEVDIIVLDSVAALVTETELNGDMGQSHVGLLARLMSQAMRKLTAACSKTGTTIIFINQVREKVGVMYGNPETTPGGRALKFHASQRVEIRRGNITDAKIKTQEGIAKIKVVKNKVAAPYKTCELKIAFNKGVNKEDEIMELAIEFDLIKKGGAYFKYFDPETGEQVFNAQGKLKLAKELDDRPEIMELLEEEIRKILANGGQIDAEPKQF